jgi:serine/threonine protein phosphatase PrpC
VKLRAGATTDTGLFRERNEDAYLAEDPLFAVADGLGGHLGGEVASRVALERLSEVARGDGPEDGIPERLRTGMHEANRAVHDRASKDRRLTGMGTTLTAVIAGKDRIFLAHVGDSRAYLFRGGDLRLLTEDHTLVQRMVREGRLTPEQAEIHPQRSVLTRALGIDDQLEVDQTTLETAAGDRLLLCSDGLTGMVEDEEILKILSAHNDPQAASDALVEAANAAGGQDNITTIVLDVLDAEPPPPLQPADAEARTGAVARTAPPPRRRVPTPRLLFRFGVLLLVIAGLVAGLRLYVDRQWFVGVNEGNVALFRGVPTKVLGLELASLVQETRISADTATQLQTWRQLEDGITAGSESEARAILAQIEADVRLQPVPSNLQPTP